MIRVLDDRLVNKIAAGEVVERPASAVKELFENALDAGATVVSVDLRSGGRNRIVISDNGAGMTRSDASLCIERHATSKLRSDADLFSIGTLGFRGEALPSIAAVSRFELLTRRPEDEAGTRVVLEGGRLVRIEDAGAAPGTRVTVRSLFFNVPARRKFLRTVATELSHCLEAVTRQALIRPELDATVLHDGHTPLRAPAVSTLAERAAALLGPHGRALVPVSFASGSLEVDALVSPVGVHKASARGASYLYVNGRFVTDPLLRRAVREAYRGIVPKGRHPTVVVHVRVPLEHVDVNVHPSKVEVRFAHGRELGRALVQGLREGLERHGIQQPVREERGARGVGRAPLAGGAQVSLPTRAAGETPTGDEPRRWTPSIPALPPGLRQPREDGPTVASAPEPRPWADPPAAVAPGATPDADLRRLLPVARFADLRVLGQLDRTYVLCEGGGELVIIDQHAAHERVTLDRLRRAARAHLGGGQRLLQPVMVELSAARTAALADHTALLAQHGLEVEPFGGTTVAVKQVPEALTGADPQRLVEDVADDLANGGEGRPAQVLVDHILSTMACHSSVRAGQTLSPYEMRELLRALDQVDFEVCAHGRPVSIRIGSAELERRFHRS